MALNVLPLKVTLASMGATGTAAFGSVTKHAPAFGSETGKLPPVFILPVVESISNNHEKVPSPFSLQTG